MTRVPPVFLELERRFQCELKSLTERATRAAQKSVRTASGAEKRDMFDDGLRDWAECLGGCAAEFVPKFAPFSKKRTRQRRQEFGDRRRSVRKGCQ